MSCPSTRAQMLLCIQRLGFMVDDIRLFLNTHPDSSEALAAIKRYVALKRVATREFERLYGPLTLEALDDGCEYDWIDCPWPWEVEA